MVRTRRNYQRESMEREGISAFYDNEIGQKELSRLKDALARKETKCLLAIYAVIGQHLRSDSTIPEINSRFSEKLKARLQSEYERDLKQDDVSISRTHEVVRKGEVEAV